VTQYVKWTNRVGQSPISKPMILRFASEASAREFSALWPNNCEPAPDFLETRGRWSFAPRYGGTDACASLSAHNGMIWIDEQDNSKGVN